MTQAEYNAISTPNAATLYLILGETNAIYLGATVLVSSGFSPLSLFAGAAEGLWLEVMQSGGFSPASLFADGQKGLLFKPER
jgi:hypothetical protein